MSPRRRVPTLALIALLVAALLPAAGAAAVEDPIQVVDDMESGLPSGIDADDVAIGWGTFQDPNSTVGISTTTPPVARPDAPAGNLALQLDADVEGFAGTSHLFTNDAVDTWTPQDWSSFEGFAVWVHGQGTNTTMFVDVVDNRGPGSTADDAERWSVDFVDDFTGWQLLEWTWDQFARKNIGNGAPDDGFNLTEVHGWAMGALTTSGPVTWYVDDVQVFGTRSLALSFEQPIFTVDEDAGTAVVTVELTTTSPDPVEVTVATSPSTDRTSSEDLIATPDRDYVPTSEVLTIQPGQTSASMTVPLIDDAFDEVPETFLVEITDAPEGLEPGPAGRASVSIIDDDVQDPRLLEDFEEPNDPALLYADGSTTIDVREIADGDPDAIPGQGSWEHVLDLEGTGTTGHRWAFPRDLSDSQGMSVWLNGAGDGAELQLTLEDNRAPDPGPDGWVPIFADEFDAASGTPADPAVWSYETGGWGWGNQELQYYTDSTDNAAHDGYGNMVITAREVADPEAADLPCWYGPCTHTSARLITEGKAEFGYGRWEARVLVAEGTGIWPAFWSLGNDFRRVNWPQTGEIDVMEFVGRLPTSVFGTIHGPGYAGGASYGSGPIEVGEFLDGVPVGEEVSERYYDFAVEWQEGLITWELNNQQYHTAVPADVAPNQWVFDHPFNLLLNVALGGNFGGALGPDLVLPQQTLIDWVRVTGAPDSAERFTATITDDVEGWTQVTIPWTDFSRSPDQPAGAPDDGLTLNESWGWQLAVPDGQARSVDQIRVTAPPCVDTAVVTSAADSGEGTLRAALASACAGATITVDEALAGTSVPLTSELIVVTDVTIDASAAPGFTLSGEGSVRVMTVQPETSVALEGFTLANGAGAGRGGAILNLGDLIITDGVVRDSVETAVGVPAFDAGGGGIWTGEGARLELVRTTVADNSTVSNPAGGLFGFFDSELVITDSTISGNVGADVAGGIRSLGTLTVRDSTISGNTSTAWHGGGIFATDGAVTLESTTIVGNSAPAGTAGGIVAANFGTPVSVSTRNTIVAGNTVGGSLDCSLEGGGGPIVSLGGSLDSDNSCGFAGDSDLPGTDPGLGDLADNGGPTSTHLPAVDSPVVDTGVEGCDDLDQRGVERDDACDIGSVEFVAESGEPGEPGPGEPSPGPGEPGPGPGEPGPGEPGPGEPGEPGPSEPEENVLGQRLDGETRIETAVSISQLDFADGEADVVVLATAADYPDALTGGPLAVAENGPLLLTFPETLAEASMAELQRVLPVDSQVIILGGNLSIPDEIEAAVADLGYAVDRVAGPSRIETAIAVAERLGTPDPLLLATGYNFPDALSAGAAAATNGGAVLLLGDGQRAASTDAYLATRDGTEQFAIGGPATMAYPDATPLAGSGREETAVAVAQAFFPDAAVVGLARGDDYPDALAGGPHIARRGGPLLLTSTDALSESVARYVCATPTVSDWVLYGGEAAIAPVVDEAMLELVMGADCES